MALLRCECEDFTFQDTWIPTQLKYVYNGVIHFILGERLLFTTKQNRPFISYISTLFALLLHVRGQIVARIILVYKCSIHRRNRFQDIL